MRNDRAVHDISDLGANRYPHLKITRERFPRALATRCVEYDGDEYFGAFMPKTAVRILIDFINKTFRLRGCDIPIDGTFPAPCTQYFRRRCVAPCVSSLCSEVEYDGLVSLLRLFLGNQPALFRKAIGQIIEAFSEEMEFERAAYYRDIMLAVEKYLSQERWHVWLDDAVDTFAVEETPDGVAIYLVTHRGRRVLGRKVFHVDREDFEVTDLALERLIDSFYVNHLPREIRVSVPFRGRQELMARLTERHGREAKIVVANPAAKGINAYRGLMLSRDEVELDKAKPLASPEIISAKLRNIFGLSHRPRRIEAFDVAHISGTGMVAASAVWEMGRWVSMDYQFILSDMASEPEAIADAVVRTLARLDRSLPDLILLDGGKGQLNKVWKAIGDLDGQPPVIAAVKPPGRHSSIAAFLSPGGGSVPFDVDSPAHAMLQLLRDEAHDLANRTHRDYREMKPFYEAAGFDEPLIVPIRLHEANGGAEDLIPIETR